MKLLKIQPLDNYCLSLLYDDGVSGVVDLSAYVGRGVFATWEVPGVFEQVRLNEFGCPEWPGDVNLCPDALYFQLTRKSPREVFSRLNHLPAHA
jgi:hypothetical protein